MTPSSQGPQDLNELYSWCENHGLSFSPKQRDQIRNYLETLEVWLPKVALFGAGEGPLMVSKHLPDAFFVATLCPERGHTADLGSGGGLPGIPMAIAKPELTVDLIESKSKKISFLSEAAKTIPNARPRNTRIEALGSNMDSAYDLVVARALAPLKRLLPMSRPLLDDGGTLLAMKASSFQEELAEVTPADVGFKLTDARPYDLPSGDTRVVLSFEAIPQL